MRHVEDSLKTHALTLALLRAVFDVVPVLCPLLAPFKWQTAALTDFGLKAVLGLGYWWHALTLNLRTLLGPEYRETRQIN